MAPVIHRSSCCCFSLSQLTLPSPSGGGRVGGGVGGHNPPPPPSPAPNSPFSLSPCCEWERGGVGSGRIEDRLRLNQD